MTTTWNIDTTHSTIGFSIRHMVFSKVRGRFGTYAGALELDDDRTKSRATVTIEAASIDTGTPQRDTHLKSADFFDVEKFPELRFASTSIEEVAKDRYRVLGQLTIKDVTNEVALDLEITGEGVDPWGNQRLGFIGKTSIDRKAFGLHWNQLLEAGGVLVGDRVDIELDVQAVKAAKAQAA